MVLWRTMKLIDKLFNLKSAFRVLEIMDKCGADIENMSPSCEEEYPECWAIRPKWYVNREDAEDLRRIVLYGYYYKNPPKLMHRLFYNDTRYGCRPR